MDRTERFHLIDQMLVASRVVSRQRFVETLEISPATFKRDLEYLRDRLGAPIVWDRELRGYRYEQLQSNEKPFQLPGLWFNAGEIQALLTMQAWLENLQPGLLSEHIKPLKSRIRGLLDQSDHSVDDITQRIRIMSQTRKSFNSKGIDSLLFAVISQALLNRKRLQIVHFNRSSGLTTEREISPQRLTFYRDNWYLDSWCHQRKAIRSFAVDAIQQAELLSKAAIDVDNERLDKELASGYGIFSGAQTRTAELRFTPQSSRWVANEQWHPLQESRFDDQGYYYLKIPYSQETELMMDILKHGSGVEVLQPRSLRRSVIRMIRQMHEIYSDDV